MTWMQTWKGRAFDLLTPRAEGVDWEDLARSLSRIPRYLAHTAHERPYSVAQHSLIVEALLPADASPRLRMAALLHDGHEAYIGDMPTPVKRALHELSFHATAAWTVLEDRVQDAIHGAAGLSGYDALDGRELEIVKRADLTALAVERRDLMAPCDRDWCLPYPAPEGHARIHPWAANYAEWRFAQRLTELQAARAGELLEEF